MVIILLSCIGLNSIHAEIKIEVIYPKEGSQVVRRNPHLSLVMYCQSKLIFRSTIYDQVYPNGAFLAFVPVEPGNFSFVCRALQMGIPRVVRNVYIPYYLKTSLRIVIIDTSYVFPKKIGYCSQERSLKSHFKGLRIASDFFN